MKSCKECGTTTWGADGFQEDLCDTCWLDTVRVPLLESIIKEAYTLSQDGADMRSWRAQVDVSDIIKN